MKASVFYRMAAGLILLFDIGHTLGFRQSDPTWGVDTLLSSMRSIHFEVQGFSRTYWDLFVGAGLFVSVFLLFAAVLAWQLGGLSAETLARMRPTAWALALCFVARDDLELEIPVPRTYRFLALDYGVFGGRGMAFCEANLKVEMFSRLGVTRLPAVDRFSYFLSCTACQRSGILDIRKNR